jgi:hypothetical protein
MACRRRALRRILVGAMAPLLAGVATLPAQGVTGAAIQGRITGSGRGGIGDATVLVTNTTTGERWQTATTNEGRYAFDRLSVGGPYRLEVRAIGFSPAAVDGLMLALGERRPVDVPLVASAFALAPLEVQVSPPPPGGNTGPSRTIGTDQLARLPLLNRDVLDLVGESPQAVSNGKGLTVNGQGPLANRFQIDGGDNTSLYGQFANTPGGLINLISPPGGGGLRTVALDAVQEIQVLIAPFDVRQGGFTGGLINAVTKSGTNTVDASVFATLQNQWLAGKDLEGQSLPDFHTFGFGGTVGGPIARDRLHGFLAADLQASVTPYGGPLIGSDTISGADSAGVGIRYASALRFQRILKETYGVDPGSIGVIDTRNPAQSLFGKLSLQAGVNSQVELSQSYVHGVIQGFLASRDPHGIYGLTSSDGRYSSTTTATRATWNTQAGRAASNELIAAYLVIRDHCRPAALYPLVTVQAENGALQAGRNTICPATTLAQHALEVTDNFTIHVGAHRLLGGMHDEFLAFRDPTTLGSTGAWGFTTLDELAGGHATEFTRTTTGALRAEGPVADFRVRQLGLYFQDEWSSDPGLTVTAGIRVDVPFFPDRPVHNPDLQAALGVDTGRFPSGRPLWSPRLGVSYTPRSGTITLRSGVGLFTGRPPYFVPADAYRSTGLEQFLVACFGDDVPDFTLDPSRQPTACRGSDAIPVPRITYVDASFHFPQELKFSAGLDATLPLGLRATADLLVGRTRFPADFVDVNLAPTGAVLAGEGGRILYGTLDASGAATPNRPTSAFTSVVRQDNGRGDRFVSISLGATKHLGHRGEIDASYTYGEARDRMPPPGGLGISLSGLGVAADQIGGTPLDGALEHRRLARSGFDVPHRLRVSGTMEIPLGAALSVIYEGGSGSPYTYVVDGDINADGFGPELFGQQSNDPVYVPESSMPGGDLALVDVNGVPATAAEYATLARYIETESCLRRSRGALQRRNTCRNPWRTQLDARLAKAVTVPGRRTLGLTLDVFNLLHLLDGDWGLVRRTADFGLEEVPLLRLVGFDPVGGRGIYQLRPPDRRHVDLDASRWRMQIGARLDF